MRKVPLSAPKDSAGNPPDAFEIMPTAESERRAAGGDDSDEVLAAAGVLADVLRRRGKRAEAGVLLISVLAAADAKDGGGGRPSMDRALQLGLCLLAQGRPADAIPYLRRSLDIATRLFPDRDPTGAVRSALRGLGLDLR